MNNNSITYFAKTNFRNQEKTFGIKTDDRRRHMYLIGKTGMGKTNLLENMIIQDIRNGYGVAYFDPHGDTAEHLLNFIPTNRINDVVYFNPADQDYPIAFNILETIEGKEKKHLICSSLMGVFKKIWPDVWSARMEYILNNTILALLDFPGSTMLGINRMFSDKGFRQKVVDKIADPVIKSFWINEFAKYTDRLATEATSAVQNKVGQFLSSSIIRNIIGQTKSTINMRDIMDNQKILIVNLSKGKIGEDNMKLLGGMLITKLQLAAMERVDMPEDERKDFYLYVDELQNFVNESFAGILSEARKYRLSLILAHQYIAQLPEVIRDAIFGNAGTLVTFRIGAEDAEFLEKEFEPVIMMNDIINLPKYNIYLKLMIDGIASNAFSAVALPPAELLEKSSFDKAIRISRERYGKHREDVEEKINRWIGFVMGERGIERTDKGQISANENRELYKVDCAQCGKPTHVPFEPDDRRPILCEKCLKEARTSGKVFSYKKTGNGQTENIQRGNGGQNQNQNQNQVQSQSQNGSKANILGSQNSQKEISIKDALKKAVETSKNVTTKTKGQQVDVGSIRNLIQDAIAKRENSSPAQEQASKADPPPAQERASKADKQAKSQEHFLERTSEFSEKPDKVEGELKEGEEIRF